MLKLSSSISLFFFAFPAFAEVQEFDAAKIKSLEIINTSGDIDIKGNAKAKATVKIEKKEFGKNCSLTVALEKDQLMVETKKNGIAGSECKVEFDLNLPQKIDIKVVSGSGDLDIEGTHGALNFTLGNGEVDVDAKLTKLEGKSGNGDIKVKSVSGDSNVHSGNGKVSVQYAQVPEKGNALLRTGNGNIELSVPASAKVNADLQTGMGKVDNELGSDKKGSFNVKMQSGLGDLKLKKI